MAVPETSIRRPETRTRIGTIFTHLYMSSLATDDVVPPRLFSPTSPCCSCTIALHCPRIAMMTQALHDAIVRSVTPHKGLLAKAPFQQWRIARG